MNNKKVLNNILKKTAQLIEPAIKELLLTYVDPHHQKMAGYQILAGGKRIRPTLAIISCQLLGGKTQDVLYPAASLEILHNYTLIVDDIIDHSSFRRDKPTAWKKFGQSIAECIGVYYGAAVFQGALKSKYPTDISDLFSKTLKNIVDGEILDILFERIGRENEPYIVKNRPHVITQKDYFKMVSQKTASLIKACCQAGGICAGASEKVKILGDYGFNLGIAFQIQDDLLDIFGKEKVFGKKIGKDIMERKLGNIVILLALEELKSKNQKELYKILDKPQIFDKDISVAVQLIKKTNAKAKAQSLSQDFIQKAKENLRQLPQNKWNDILTEITDFVIEREK